MKFFGVFSQLIHVLSLCVTITKLTWHTNKNFSNIFNFGMHAEEVSPSLPYTIVKVLGNL